MSRRKLPGTERKKYQTLVITFDEDEYKEVEKIYRRYKLDRKMSFSGFIREMILRGFEIDRKERALD